MKLQSLFLPFFALLLSITLPVIAQDTPAADPDTVLMDATHSNGSFEKNTHGWSFYAHGCKVIGKGIKTNPEIPDGKQYAYMTVTGNDVSRLDGRFEYQLTNIKPANGSIYKLNAVIRSRSLEQYNAVIVNLIFIKNEVIQDPTTGKTSHKRNVAGVVTGKVFMLQSTDWTALNQEMIFKKTDDYDQIGIRIAFFRAGATGALIEGECYLDNVVLTQHKSTTVKKKSLTNP